MLLFSPLSVVYLNITIITPMYLLLEVDNAVIQCFKKYFRFINLFLRKLCTKNKNRFILMSFFCILVLMTYAVNMLYMFLFMFFFIYR